MNDKIRRLSLLAVAAGQGGGTVVEFYNPNPNYLTIVALEDGCEVDFSSYEELEYSIDGSDNWVTIVMGDTTPAINTGQYISFRGNWEEEPIGPFNISTPCNLTGNCNSLLFGDDAANNLDLSGHVSCYYGLFSYCPVVEISPTFLPATTLTEHCYSNMFQNCESLITAPQLPATTLASYCYYEMFLKCESLAAAPQLPAINLVSYCYKYMFQNCESLITAPQLPATTLRDSCYYGMFSNTNVLPDCSNINFSSSDVVAFGGLKGLFAGTKVTDSDLRSILPINSNGKYYLPATTLAGNCYSEMFYDCAFLITAPELPATTLARSCYYRMFRKCTKLITAPELPAKTLVSSCYSNMFQDCSKLSYIKAMFTTTPSSSYTYQWVSGVASSGTFVKNIDATWDVAGINGIPSGWSVVYNFIPQECLDLSITADDISGKETSTTVYYTATVKGLDDGGNTITKTITGTDTVEVGQNTSTTNGVTKTVSYTYMGVTATTTITQDPWVDASYTVNLNSQWQKSSTISNPNTSTYDGVYESYSNKGINNSGASMYIDINGYTNFKLYIRSYAESSYDYVMVSQLDKTLAYNTSYNDTALVKAHTRSNQQSGTALSNYKLVEFTNIDGGSHRIQIIYRKDSSTNYGDDRGYVLIPKNQ